MNLEKTIHNKKHKFRRLTRRPHYRLNRRSTSTTLRIYLIEIGANIAYRAKANHNIINEEDLSNRASHRSTMPTSRATTTSTTRQY
eukprot:1907348-Amphidinium_carterae.1